MTLGLPLLVQAVRRLSNGTSIFNQDVSVPIADLLNLQMPDSLSVNGETVAFIAGEDLVFGDPCYIKSDSKMWKADANGSDTFPADSMSAGTVLAGHLGLFLMRGWACKDAWTWTPGGLLYLSTSGTITQTAPTATDDVNQILGKASTSNIIYFAPERNYTTHV